MSFLGHRKIDDVLTFYANTLNGNGNRQDADSAPPYRVYEEETGTAILTGTMALLDSSNTTGFYSEQITLSAANGFEAGKDYAIYIEADVDLVGTAPVQSAAFHTFTMESVPADVVAISGDSGAADALEAAFDGTGSTLTLTQLRINSTSANGAIDIDNSAGPAISARTSSGDSVEFVSTGGNGDGFVVTGQGSGMGMLATAGATGHGASFVGGATSGDGVSIAATAGNGRGIAAIGQGSGSGFVATGGDTAGSGILGVGGATDGVGIQGLGRANGAGIRAEGGADATGVGANGFEGMGSSVGGCGGFFQAGSNTAGIRSMGDGTGPGIQIDGGAGADGLLASGSTTGHGARFVGGATNGDGIRLTGQGSGAGLRSTGGATGVGATFLAGGGNVNGITATGAGSGVGILASGGSSGIGFAAAAGGGNAAGISATGSGTAAGISAAGGVTNGHGILSTGAGTGAGLRLTAGDTGHGLDARGGATSGDGIHAEATTGDGIEAVGAGGGFDINADIQGSLSGSVGSIAAGGITAASFTANSITASALASDAADEIIAAVSGTADSGSTTTIVDAARTEADTDYWAGSIVLITSGSTQGQMRRITAFDPGTDTITVDPAFTQSISTNTYLILRTAIGTASGGGGPTAAQIADAVWDEDIVAAHGTADTSGLILSQLTRRAVTFNTDVDDDSVIGQLADDGTATFDRTTDSLQAIADSVGGVPSAADIADAVWDEARAGHVGAGSFGEYVFADTIRISDDAGAANSLESILDGTGAVMTLTQLAINSTAAGGAIDIDNSAGPAISARSSSTFASEMVSTGGNGSGLVVIGNGSGAGVAATGGATASGITATAGGGNTHGIIGTGAGTGSGLRGVGGATGTGIHGFGGATAGDGIRGQGQGNGHGFQAIGGATAGNSGFVGQSGVAGHGFYAFGDGAGDGMRLEGGVTGHGLDMLGGATSGDGFHAVAPTLGDGIEAVGAGGGFDINADIQGALSGSVGSVAANGITASSLDSTAIGEIADGVWDEDIVAAHGTADTSGLILSQLTRRSVTFNTAVADGSIIGQVADDGVASFDRTTDSLQAIADSGGGGPTAGQIADAVWDELIAGHLLVGSTGEALNNAAAGGGTDWTAPEREQIRQALGVTGAVAATSGTGTLETAVAGVQSDTDDIQARLPATLNGGRMRSHVEACDPPCTGGGGGGSSADTFEAVPG